MERKFTSVIRIDRREWGRRVKWKHETESPFLDQAREKVERKFGGGRVLFLLICWLWIGWGTCLPCSEDKNLPCNRGKVIVTPAPNSHVTSHLGTCESVTINVPILAGHYEINP
jgi:hypothetical protein